MVQYCFEKFIYFLAVTFTSNRAASVSYDLTEVVNSPGLCETVKMVYVF